MRRYYKRNLGKLDEVSNTDQADVVFIEKEELETLEHRLQNKTAEVAKWIKRVSGDGLEYKLVTVDYLSEKAIHSSSGGVSKDPSRVFVTIALPIAFQMNKATKDKAKKLVEQVFKPYIKPAKGYKLHFAPKSGWSFNIEMTEEEFDSFQLPN